MARVLIKPDKLRLGSINCEAEIITTDEGTTVAHTSCGETITDRGHFEDTIQAASVHVDICDK